MIATPSWSEAPEPDSPGLTSSPAPACAQQKAPRSSVLQGA